MNELNKLAEIWRFLLDEADNVFSHELVFFPLLLKLSKNASRILEVGAGKGRMVKVLRRHGIKSEIVCLDVNAYVKKAPGVPIIGDTRALPFHDNSFDLVYSLGVVEHVKEIRSSIWEHIRVTKRGGHILITTPRLSIYTPLVDLWFFKYKKRGSFKESMGSNLSLKKVREWFAEGNANIYDYGRSGYFLPGLLRRAEKVARIILPERYFGAYLWCLATKR